MNARTVAAFLIGALLAVSFGALATSLAPAPPTANSTFSETFRATTAETTTIGANATACAAPGGASCTVILPKTNVASFNNLTVYVKNSHASAAITNILIETSPDGTSWEEVVADTFDALAAGKLKSVNWLGHYAFVRVEAQATSASSSSVWLSAYRP